VPLHYIIYQAVQEAGIDRQHGLTERHNDERQAQPYRQIDDGLVAFLRNHSAQARVGDMFVEQTSEGLRAIFFIVAIL
jgi:hypothetical protein